VRSQASNGKPRPVWDSRRRENEEDSMGEEGKRPARRNVSAEKKRRIAFALRLIACARVVAERMSSVLSSVVSIPSANPVTGNCATPKPNKIKNRGKKENIRPRTQRMD